MRSFTISILAVVALTCIILRSDISHKRSDGAPKRRLRKDGSNNGAAPPSENDGPGVEHVPCITVGDCQSKIREMGVTSFLAGDFPIKGCFRNKNGGKAFFSLGSTEEMSGDLTTGRFERVRCDPVPDPSPSLHRISDDGDEPSDVCSNIASASSVVAPDPKPAAAADLTVGVFYYPWHGKNFHNGEGYLRRELRPRQVPALCEYDDTDPAVIGRHLRWSRRANVDLWITSWWGPHSREDNTTRDVILPHPELPGTRVAIFYETMSRITKRGRHNGTALHAYSDVEYIARTYFDHPSYMRINDRPVLFVYLTRVLSDDGILGNVTDMMRAAAMANGGHDVYIIGDQVMGNAPNGCYEPFALLDGVTNYDVYGNLGRPDGYAGLDRLDDLFSRNKEWRDRTRERDYGCAFIPSVSPGYNDKGVRFRAGHAALSRKIHEGAEEGSLFRRSLQRALQLTDESTGRMIVVNSWNEWHEDTQIEPVVGVRGENASTAEPLNFTSGLRYEAYGGLYLDILRNATSKPPATRLEIVGNDGRPPHVFPLGACQGDCDSDEDCAGLLLCYQRGVGDPVPGCKGNDRNSKTDYCTSP